MMRSVILVLAIALGIANWAAAADPPAKGTAVEASGDHGAAGHDDHGHTKYELLPDTSDAQTWYSALWVLIIFVVANSDPVPVSYVFVEGKPRLIWVMLVCAVLGGIIGFAVGRPGKELRRTSKQDRQRGRDT